MKHAQSADQNNLKSKNPPEYQIAPSLAKHENYKRLSDEGKHIVAYRSAKNLKVLAGAGSGKTEVLILRIVNLLLLEEVSPAEIVIFTFTNNAADELKQRLYHYMITLGTPNLIQRLQKMFIGTIHGFCWQILQDHFDYGKFEVLSDETEIIYLQKYAYQLQLFSVGSNQNPTQELQKPNIEYRHQLKDDYMQNCLELLSTLNIFYNEEKTPPEIAVNFPGVAKAWQKLEKLLEKDHQILYNQLISKSIEHLSQTDLPQYIKKLRYLVVDEFQDINRAQFHLIQILKKP